MKKSYVLLIVLAVLAFLVSFTVLIVFLSKDTGDEPVLGDESELTEEEESEVVVDQLAKFETEDDYVSYLSEVLDKIDNDMFQSYGVSEDAVNKAVADAPLTPSLSGGSSRSDTPARYSETNIQVQGVDEPDVVKTDGVNIYVSEDVKMSNYSHRDEDENLNKTKIIEAFPVENMKMIKEMEEAGKLFLRDDTLVIIGNEKVSGFNVSSSNNPKLEWKIDIDEKTRIVNARMYDSKIYFVIANRVTRDFSCVTEPLIINERPLKIDCVDIYHPKKVFPVDTVYTLLKVDLLTGEEESKISLLGSIFNSIVYMSGDNFYLSYFEPVNFVDFFITFLVEECDDLIPGSTIERIKRLDEYDIGFEAKMTEIETIFEEFSDSMTYEEMEEFGEELFKRIPSFYQKNKYELDYTEIVKIGLDDLKIKAVGNVPGKLLNQFALDEYQGDLRVATTLGDELFEFLGPDLENDNEVHILDDKLRQRGVVRKLGLGERIYSVRFLQDKGYVVTYREIDPFYILDLSDPDNPAMKGELKIPGYSSYLHPVDENYILGIGKENWNVKVSLFDVRDPFSPKEKDKYILSDSSWSEVLSNHHAFLLDSKHEMFFLPGRNGAYIFSFKDGKLELIKEIEQTATRRALYIDDYLYVVGGDSVIVLDQNNWEMVKKIEI